MSDAMQTRERITDPDFLSQVSRVTADWIVESTTFEQARQGVRVYRGEFAGTVIEVVRDSFGVNYYELTGFTGWTFQ